MAKEYKVEVIITAKHYSSVTVTSLPEESEQGTIDRALLEAESLIIRGEDDEAEPEVLEVELERWVAGEDDDEGGEDEEQAEEGLGAATA